MGNTPINANARNTVSPLAITAVSRRLKLKKTKVIYLREVLNSLADDDDDCIKYDHFKEGLKQAKFLKPREVDVFDLLFTMWDHDGKGKISFKNLVVGIAPLACPEEDLGKVLQFAMIISDEDKRGTIGRDELENVMYSLDSTASYFGDPHLKDKSIRKIVDTIFEDDKHAEMTHEVCIRRLAFNQYIKRFVRGAARSRVKFKKNLVEEIFEEIDASPVSTPSIPPSPEWSSWTSPNLSHLLLSTQSKDRLQLRKDLMEEIFEDNDASPVSTPLMPTSPAWAWTSPNFSDRLQSPSAASFFQFPSSPARRRDPSIGSFFGS